MWKRLRDEAPAYYNEEYDFWALSRFEDVERAHREPLRYSSAHSTVLEAMTEEAQSEGMMIFLDPPEHTSMRRLVSKAFTPRRVAELEQEIRTLCAGLLDRQQGQDSFDYVQDFGARLPATVIATLLGVPASDREDVRHHIDGLFHIEPGVGMANDASLESGAWLYTYIGQQVEERQRKPRDDMLTDLVQAEIVGNDGTPTPPHPIGMHGVRDPPRQRRHGDGGPFAGLGRAHPGGPSRAADRVGPGCGSDTRMPSRSSSVTRLRHPCKGGGSPKTSNSTGNASRRIPKVLLLTGSAGRDERVYPAADSFDIRRDFKLHVAFGYGIHFCLGAALARMEGKIALEETFKRYKSWTVDKEHAVPLHTSTVRGYLRLPIRV